ncbi:MAG: transposase [Candidatus Latescibacteria bacterium]|nr:transposase [Candidatus Latescibacterota bacterium]MCK5733382.1 transposase [Candidatus Latescibacterota bacterium]
MAHSLAKIWIHTVFGVKDNQSLLLPAFRNTVHKHITSKLTELSCRVRIVNGVADHLHGLFLLPREDHIAHIMKYVKGESSHWINQSDFLKVKFSWQVGYGAFSVSESNVKQVEAYIANQEAHHRKMSFEEEYERLMNIHFPDLNR